MTKGFRANNRCPLCGYYDHGGKMDSPRCVGFESRSGWYCSQVRSDKESKNFFGVTLYYHPKEVWESGLKSESPSDSPASSLPSPPLPLGLGFNPSPSAFDCNEEEDTKSVTTEGSDRNLNTTLTKERGLPGGFCGYHSSHFCPCSAPQLYEQGPYRNKKKEAVRWP